MNLEDLKKEFDDALAKMSDQDLVDAFAELGCEVEINHDLEDWTLDEVSCDFVTRPTMLSYTTNVEMALCAADSNELALAA